MQARRKWSKVPRNEHHTKEGSCNTSSRKKCIGNSEHFTQSNEESGLQHEKTKKSNMVNMEISNVHKGVSLTKKKTHNVDRKNCGDGWNISPRARPDGHNNKWAQGSNPQPLSGSTLHKIKAQPLKAQRVSLGRRRHPARMADTRCSTLLHEWSQAAAFHIIIPSLLRLEQAANALHHLEKLPPLVGFGSPVQTLPTGRVWEIFPMHHLCYRGARQARAATSLWSLHFKMCFCLHNASVVDAVMWLT